MINHHDTSWETSSSWYDKIVGAKGHYYHQQVIIPGVLKLLALSQTAKPHLLDLACGQGILARHLPKATHYLGVDASKSLIRAAKEHHPKESHSFLVRDLLLPTELPQRDFTHATCILAIQNLHDPAPLLQTAAAHLIKGAPFILVLNHPCFRIPRQSSWGIDEPKKLQYRRVDRYMTELKIPIQTHPGQGDASEGTWSFHRPLSYFAGLLQQAGFTIESIEEWCSDKKSVGKAAAMENRSRGEFPLFMALAAKKK